MDSNRQSIGAAMTAKHDSITAAMATPRERFIKRMATELDHAYAKHGRDPWGRHEFYGVLKEEVDELWDAIKADKPMGEVLEEVAQIACVCLRYVETGDRYRGDHPELAAQRADADLRGEARYFTSPDAAYIEWRDGKGRRRELGGEIGSWVTWDIHSLEEQCREGYRRELTREQAHALLNKSPSAQDQAAENLLALSKRIVESDILRPTIESHKDLSAEVEALEQALAAEQAARAEAERERDQWRSKAKVRADEADALEARAADAERERDEYREGFHAAYEMYGAAVAIFKEQRRVLGVPEDDGVSITDHCADLVRRLGVARVALKNADTMLRAARTRLVASGATMDVYDVTLAETKEALAALGQAPTPTTPKAGEVDRG